MRKERSRGKGKELTAIERREKENKSSRSKNSIRSRQTPQLLVRFQFGCKAIHGLTGPAARRIGAAEVRKGSSEERHAVRFFRLFFFFHHHRRSFQGRRSFFFFCFF